MKKSEMTIEEVEARIVELAVEANDSGTDPAHDGGSARWTAAQHRKQMRELIDIHKPALIARVRARQGKPVPTPLVTA